MECFSKVLLFHIVAAAMFGYAIYYDFLYVVAPSHIRRTTSSFGGKFKYLTFIDVVRKQSEFPQLSLFASHTVNLVQYFVLIANKTGLHRS